MEKRERALLSGDIKGILKNVARTLYLSVKIMPEPVKTSMGMGYLLCRVMDTVVDNPGICIKRMTAFKMVFVSSTCRQTQRLKLTKQNGKHQSIKVVI